MSHCSERNRFPSISSTNATGISHVLRRRKTFEVVRFESEALPLMISCLAPSPAVRSSLDSTITRPGVSVIRIFFVFPSANNCSALVLFICVLLSVEFEFLLPPFRDRSRFPGGDADVEGRIRENLPLVRCHLLEIRLHFLIADNDFFERLRLALGLKREHP